MGDLLKFPDGEPQPAPIDPAMFWLGVAAAAMLIRSRYVPVTTPDTPAKYEEAKQ